MVKIDFSVAIALFLSLPIAIVFIYWIFYNYRESSVVTDITHLQQCNYCTYIFFTHSEANLQMCPQCKSYIAVNTNKKGEAVTPPTS